MSRRSRKTRKRRDRSGGSYWHLLNKWTVGGATLILIGLAGFLVAVNQPGPAATTEAPAAGNQPDIPAPEIPRTSLEEAKTKFDTGTALFVDTRSMAEYQQSHIPDAVPLPLDELNTRNPDLPLDAEIITYCT